MQLPFEQILRLLLAECYNRRNTVFVFFVIISLSCLGVGSVWPKRFTSFAIIHADDTNILLPLMAGTAETTKTEDHAANTREIIFGEIIMDQVLLDAGWQKEDQSEIDVEKIKQHIKRGTKIRSVGDSLIKISYTNSDSLMAFNTAKSMANLFINMGEQSKIDESESAFQFIEKQVNQYLNKLTQVEEELTTFRAKNPDSRPGSEIEVSNRITRLNNDIEQTRLDIREARIRRNSLKEQLSGEAAISISQSKEGLYRNKIATAQHKLETLLLDYKETYPDIVRIKHQIEDLTIAMGKERTIQVEARNSAKTTGRIYIDEAVILSPFYQQLRADVSISETLTATLEARESELTRMLAREYERARKIHNAEAALSKLTRDYEVNQELYHDLLKRREKARVSRSLDQEQKGLTYKIQEPAKIPLLPTGLRFLHFVIAGLVIGLAVPIALIYGMIAFDPRIRFSRIISSELGLPVIAEITHLSSSKEKRKEKISLFLLLIATVTVVFIYGYIGWIKLSGQF